MVNFSRRWFNAIHCGQIITRVFAIIAGGRFFMNWQWILPNLLIFVSVALSCARGIFIQAIINLFGRFSVGRFCDQRCCLGICLRVRKAYDRNLEQAFLV